MIMLRVTDFIFLQAPWLLVISAIAILSTYLANRKLIASHIYLAISAPGLIIISAYLYIFFVSYRDGFEGILGPLILSFMFFPALWIFPLVTGVLARRVYLQKKGLCPAPSVSVVTIFGSAALVALYAMTAVMAETLGSL